jgi:hypothetical protein
MTNVPSLVPLNSTVHGTRCQQQQQQHACRFVHAGSCMPVHPVCTRQYLYIFSYLGFFLISETSRNQ